MNENELRAKLEELRRQLEILESWRQNFDSILADHSAILEDHDKGLTTIEDTLYDNGLYPDKPRDDE